MGTAAGDVARLKSTLRHLYELRDPLATQWGRGRRIQPQGLDAVNTGSALSPDDLQFRRGESGQTRHDLAPVCPYIYMDPMFGIVFQPQNEQRRSHRDALSDPSKPGRIRSRKIPGDPRSDEPTRALEFRRRSEVSMGGPGGESRADPMDLVTISRSIDPSEPATSLPFSESPKNVLRGRFSAARSGSQSASVVLVIFVSVLEQALGSLFYRGTRSGIGS